MAATPDSRVLLADVGGTNARFALLGADGSLDAIEVLACADHASLSDAAGAYLEGTGATPCRGAIAVASPVLGDRIAMTNRAWSFSADGVKRHLKLDDLKIVNDFAAIALAVPRLGPDDRAQIGGGAPRDGHPVVVIGPGTGLGVSALVPVGGAGDTWSPLATEGGHVTMAPVTDRESDVLTWLREKGHVSAERVISGPGLVALYHAISALDGTPTEANITPTAVVEGAGDSAVSAEAVDMFAAMLGTAASNLALSLGALGGVYIAGGIVPKLGAAFAETPFRARFEDKGRFSDYLARIPTYVITRKMPAFLGLAGLFD